MEPNGSQVVAKKPYRAPRYWKSWKFYAFLSLGPLAIWGAENAGMEWAGVLWVCGMFGLGVTRLFQWVNESEANMTPAERASRDRAQERIAQKKRREALDRERLGLPPKKGFFAEVWEDAMTPKPGSLEARVRGWWNDIDGGARTSPTNIGEVVYLVGAGKPGGLVKIGYTSGPVEDRLRALQCGSAEKLRVLAMLPGGRAEEAKLHRKFAASRQHGEWFRVTEPLARLIQANRVSGG